MTQRDYTLKEAATILGTTEGVLRVNVHRAKIAATKRGNVWFLTHAELTRLIPRYAHKEARQ